MLAASPGDSLGDTGDRAGAALGVRALLLLPSEVLTWVQGDRWGPPGVWPPVPDRCEEERDEHGEVVAPEPAVPECSGVWRPIADRMLFPFIPDGQEEEEEERNKKKKERRRRRNQWMRNDGNGSG